MLAAAAAAATAALLERRKRHRCLPNWDSGLKLLEIMQYTPIDVVCGPGKASAQEQGSQAERKVV